MKPRSLPEVAGLLQTRQAGKRQAGECHNRHHQCPAFSAVADESRCRLSLPEAVSRLRQTLQAGQAGESHRRPHQCPAFSAVAAAVAAVAAVVAVVAVAGLAVVAVVAVVAALRLPGAAGAAAQTSR